MERVLTDLGLVLNAEAFVPGVTISTLHAVSGNAWLLLAISPKACFWVPLQSVLDRRKSGIEFYIIIIIIFI